MTDYESSRKVHGLQSESGDSESDADIDSDAYNFLRPPALNYEDIKDNIVVVEARKSDRVESQNAALKRKGKKKKRWLPLTPEVIETLKTKAVTDPHKAEAEKLCLHSEKAEVEEQSDINWPSTSHSSMAEVTHDQLNEQTNYSTLQKFQNAWGNFFYRQPSEDLKTDYNNCAESSLANSEICDNIKQIWTNDITVGDIIDNQRGSEKYFHNVWENLLNPNSETPRNESTTDEHEFVSYFSDDFGETNDVKFECLEKDDNMLKEENVSDYLTSIQDIMPEDMLNEDVVSEFKHFLSNFAGLEKTQQEICIDSMNFESVLTKSSVALYNLRIFNDTLKALVNSKLALEEPNYTADIETVSVSVSIEAAGNLSNPNSLKDKLDYNVKISPSKNTNIVKPYNFVKTDKKVENKKSSRKLVIAKDRSSIEKALSKEKVKIEHEDNIVESAPIVQNTDDLPISEPHSLEELEIVEMERTLNELEFDDSNSESDFELYDKTTKTVSFVILLSKVMYIILIVIPYRHIVFFIKYLKSWPYVKSFYVRIIGQPVEVKYKNIKRKIKKLCRTYLQNVINIKFCKTVLVALVSFHLFLKIESVQPFLIWFYEFYHVFVFNVLPVVFSVFELLFLKPLYCLYEILFKNTFLKTSHVSKLVFCLVATYYTFKMATLIFKGVRTFLVQPVRKLKRYVKKQYEYLVESLVQFQNQTFVTKKERKERDYKTYKMRQIRRKN